MRHRKYTFKIGRTSAHRRSLLANAVCSLFEAGSITTTVTKAKEIRRLAERMITLGKKGTLHARRLAIAKMRDPDAVAELFADIAPGYQERNGGYTRILRLGQRNGDGAEMCILELVEEMASVPVTAAETDAKEESTADVEAQDVAETDGDDEDES